MSSSRGSPPALLPLERDGLYLVLSAIAGQKNKWHWGLYLAYDQVNGRTFHIVDRHGVWRYESKNTNRMVYSVSVVLALKIAVIEEDLQAALKDRIKEVSIVAGDTCRTWALEAVRQLNEEGWIGLTAHISYLEEEAKGAAVENQDAGVRDVQYSALCV